MHDGSLEMDGLPDRYTSWQLSCLELPCSTEVPRQLRPSHL